MSSDVPESAHHTVSELLYRAILLVWSRMMAGDTEWREVNKNLAEAAFSKFALFIVASYFLHLVLRHLFSTLVGVLASV